MRVLSAERTREEQAEELRKRKARENQKTYRAIQKQRIAQARQRVSELKKEMFDSALYLAFIVQGDLIRPSRECELREVGMKVYADYFSRGADPFQSFFEKQRVFLSFQMSDRLPHPLEGKCGYETLLKQWVMYTLLADGFSMSESRIEAVDRERNTFLLTQTVSYTITYRMIVALYPHMLNEAAFLQSVVGKQIHYEMSQLATFGSDNRIASIQMQHKIAEGWLTLLGDIRTTAKVLKNMMINENCYITTSFDTVQQLCKWHT